MPDSEKDKHMKQLKRKIESWREFILPLNSVLLWEKSWYPGLIFGTTTTLFLLIWIMEPTFVTMISMTLLFLALADYFIIVVSPTLIPSTAWNGQKERKLDEICKRLSETILQIQRWRNLILGARHDRPNFYFGINVLCLGLLAWVGNVINNLFLIYITVNLLLLLPGILQTELLTDLIQLTRNIGHLLKIF